MNEYISIISFVHVILLKNTSYDMGNISQNSEGRLTHITW